MDHDHVQIRSDRDAYERTPGRPEPFFGGHINGDDDKCAVGDESLQGAEMPKPINACFWREQWLKRTGKTNKVCEFVDAVIFCQQHVDAQPNHDAAYMQR